MTIRFIFQLLMLLCIITVTTHAQNEQASSLNIGDQVPPLRVREWIKGAPVRFEKGKVYVVEFWATWCKPCIAAMPHLSALASEYKDGITILGIDILEKQTTSPEKVKAFVDSMGSRMDYHVAAEDSNFMVTGWLDASGSRDEGIPRSFVVNAEGRLAWIGHPKDLAEVLPKIVNNTWDIKEAFEKRNLNKHLAELDRETNYELMKYSHDSSALLAIDEIIRKEPKLKYAPLIAYNTFSTLLKTNPHKAYEYGKMVLVTPSYEEPALSSIINAVSWYSDKLKLPAEIYQLGAVAYQTKIDQTSYTQIVNMPKLYNKMAEWYGRAKDKSKAINAQQKAIEGLKRKKNFSATEMAAFEFQLQLYKKM